MLWFNEKKNFRVCACVCCLTTGMNGCYLLPKEKETHFTAPISFWTSLAAIWLLSVSVFTCTVKSSYGYSSTRPFNSTTGHKLVHLQEGNRFIDRCISSSAMIGGDTPPFSLLAVDFFFLRLKNYVTVQTIQLHHINYNLLFCPKIRRSPSSSHNVVFHVLFSYWILLLLHIYAVLLPGQSLRRGNGGGCAQHWAKFVYKWDVYTLE